MNLMFIPEFEILYNLNKILQAVFLPFQILSNAQAKRKKTEIFKKF